MRSAWDFSGQQLIMMFFGDWNFTFNQISFFIINYYANLNFVYLFDSRRIFFISTFWNLLQNKPLSTFLSPLQKSLVYLYDYSTNHTFVYLFDYCTKQTSIFLSPLQNYVLFILSTIRSIKPISVFLSPLKN